MKRKEMIVVECELYILIIYSYYIFFIGKILLNLD